MKINKLGFSSIDEYLAAQPPGIREKLKKLRQTITKAAPEAEEVISYQMPAYKFHGMLVYFAVFKNHISFFPTSSGVQFFKDKLTAFEISKGTIKFPLDKPIPLRLVAEIVKFRLQENTDKHFLKKIAKKRK